MRLLTIPNQSSVAKAFMDFDEAGRMKLSAYFDCVVDVMEELVKFTLLTHDIGRISSTATASVRKARKN
jgi:arsenic resistance protein ArsH